MEQMNLSILKKHLLKEEKILWSGKSNNKRLFLKEDTFSIIFGSIFTFSGLMWIIYGICIMCGLIVKESTTPGLGIISVLMGLLMNLLGVRRLVAKTLIRKQKKEKIIYAITNKRILIIENDTNEKVISKYISQINKVDITEDKDGIGTIEFGENYPDGELSDINDVQNVYELINNLRNNIN
ncbi:hypothetical protein [Clostridium saccharoperbutylacetonicum]|uniref:hypothetical protein n=1 Tax=Clostridium saccharoperbutylacetonicum TaxID=36745 RepID=UPI0009838D84|nr:hypothetical protein [Clostridium saccharoperbutylacetonicum]AQR93138.1 hypothetical protein CLSAP_04150 [Clostridium saccharoperbutylacetonicum]NSB34550.1 putative lipid-binding transport protein (Tim44 family) [Clostridium saccharoperbutylacetonicum]